MFEIIYFHLSLDLSNYSMNSNCILDYMVKFYDRANFVENYFFCCLNAFRPYNLK